MPKIDPSLPLVDLHRHLDGSVRLATILDLGQKYHLPLPAADLETLRPYVQVTTPQPGVMAFIQKFEWMTGVLVDYDACRRIAYENVADLRQEGIDYAELRFSPWFMAEAHHLDPLGVIDAIADGVKAGQEEFGPLVQLIGILSRTYGPETAWNELETILSRKSFFAAVDLAGDEANFPGQLFVPHFKAVRDAGLHVTIHAGEARGPESIWQALNELGAERIGHAVHAPEDPRLIETLAERQVPLETNLTSNVQTSTVPDYLSHPLKEFLEKGLKASINTDDPGISGIDLPYEYEVAAPAAGLSDDEIRQAQINGFQSAFLEPGQREALTRRKRL